MLSYVQKLGPRHVELGVKWLPSLAIYGASACIALVYFTDWKVIATKIPLYNIKFKDTK